MSDCARVIQVIETTIERRGAGDHNRSPIRIITQYWSLDGKLLAEVDPCAEVFPIEREMYDRASYEDVKHRRGRATPDPDFVPSLSGCNATGKDNGE